MGLSGVGLGCYRSWTLASSLKQKKLVHTENHPPKLLSLCGMRDLAKTCKQKQSETHIIVQLALKLWLMDMMKYSKNLGKQTV